MTEQKHPFTQQSPGVDVCVWPWADGKLCGGWKGHRLHSDVTNFDPRAIRLSANLHTDLIAADCLHPGCGWTMHFSWGAQRLSSITDICEQHPCKGEQNRCTSCDHLMAIHADNGCHHTVTVGELDRNLVCPCVVQR